MKIEVNSVVVNYEVSGSGNSIIFLHGWGGSIKSFKAVQNELDKSLKTYLIDLPGFGESNEPNIVWGVEDYAKMLKEFVLKLGIENPIVVGHSFGGRVIIKSASEISFKKIILIDSAGIKPKRSLKYYIKVYSYKTAKKFFSIKIIKKHFGDWFDNYRKKAGSSDYKNASEMMKKIMSKIINQDLKGELKKISAPTLLIWGDKDTATPLSDAKIMEKMIPDAGLVVYKGAGHFSYIERFPEFMATIKYFLKDEMETK